MRVTWHISQVHMFGLWPCAEHLSPTSSRSEVDLMSWTKSTDYANAVRGVSDNYALTKIGWTVCSPYTPRGTSALVVKYAKFALSLEAPELARHSWENLEKIKSWENYLDKIANLEKIRLTSKRKAAIVCPVMVQSEITVPKLMLWKRNTLCFSATITRTGASPGCRFSVRSFEVKL